MASKLRFLRWRISLKFLFLFVTLFCVGLGALCIGPERQRAAVERIRRAGGSVHYAIRRTDESRAFTLFRSWLPRDYFDTVEGINFDLGAHATDADLCDLELFQHLEELYLGNSLVTNAGLRHVRSQKGLKHLSMHDTSISDDGLVQLQTVTQLVDLDLDGTQVTDAGLAHLRAHTELEGILLRRTQVTDTGIAELKKALPDCKIIR